MYTISDLLDLSHTKAAPLFEGKTYPYEVLDGIKGFILELGATLNPEEYDHPKEDVWIAKDAVIYPNNYIAGPCIIGHKTEVRPGAFIRGSALVGDNCVVGNSGRVLLRKSGTEPVLRVMAEATTAEACEKEVDAIIHAMDEVGQLIRIK